jgi:pimeloyl-ACP methyl ester carboxylesterase
VDVWVVVGERDGVCPPSGAFGIAAAVGRRARARLRLVEGDVGHQVMLEAPEVVNGVILEAVRRLRGGR